VNFRERDLENLKIAMVRKFGEINYSKLANEINVSRVSIYNAVRNKPYTDNIKKKLKEWVLENA